MSPDRRRVGLLAILAVVIVAAWLPGTPFYLTNDDVAMRLLAEGRFAPGAAPSPFLLFVNAGLGWVLATLYTLVGGVAWYDVLMTGTAVVATVALASVWTGPGGAVAGLSALVLAVHFLSPLFATPQFSMAGITCAAAGLALLARSLDASPPQPSRRRDVVWGSGLVVWGAFIRWDAMVLVAALALPGILLTRGPAVAAAGRAGAGAVLGPLARAGMVTMVVIAISVVANLAAYRAAPGWREFAEFNLARARLTEYAADTPPSVAALAAMQAHTGWSANDFELLRGWFFVDASLFTVEKLRTARAVLTRFAPPRLWPTIGSGVDAVRGLAVANWPALWLLACVAAAGHRPAARLAALAGLLSLLAIVLVTLTAALKQVPVHVVWPMLIMVAALLPVPVASRLRPVSAAFLVAAVAVAVMATATRWREHRQREVAAAVVARDVAALQSSGARLVAIHTSALEWERFWRPFRQGNLGVPFIGLGASAQTPPIQRALRDAGATDLVAALCRDDRVLLIAGPLLLPKLVTFMAEHHRRAVRFEAAIVGQAFTAWRCRTA